ncbi:MAG: dihydrofolate reductase [Gracilimonas sp.]|uniref:dihydrofolate reductase n=1 Tax=Gracilimonas sp. TaxID=1974203 RepID=UPI001998FFB9|nr:dihydrofolate reductase [Gracilimonas sp.]MBD3615878.1 dihydrofolate reductase [Gracilimonas sp.]
MIITLIAAHDPNLVIGKEGGLPWRYPEDLKHFKNTTLGNPIIMGRGVFEELNEIPLPDRRNIVLSRTQEYDNVESFSSLEDAFEALGQEEEVFIIGGGVLYRQSIDIADKLIITEIHKEYEGDTFFPEYRDDIGTTWKEQSREDHKELSFVVYERM